MNATGDTETLIKEAARKIFTERGLAASRTEDIATEAGVNKALVNYYFRSKDNLFSIVLKEEMQSMTESSRKVLSNTTLPVLDKIRKLVEGDFDTVFRSPNLPLFVVSEVARNPHLLADCAKLLPSSEMFAQLEQELKEEAQNGAINEVDIRHLWINVVSLVFMPFITKAWLENLFELTEAEFFDLMRERRKIAADMIIATLKKPAHQLASSLATA